MFSRINHREVGQKSRGSKNPLELATHKQNSITPAFLQPEQAGFLDYQYDSPLADKNQLVHDRKTYSRLLLIQEALDTITNKLKPHEIVQKTLQLCREVVPFEHGNIVLKRNGNWKTVRENTEVDFRPVVNALEDHGVMDSMFNKNSYVIISFGELGLDESPMNAGRILSLPMIVDSIEIGICLIFVDTDDIDSIMEDIEIVQIIIKQAALAIQYKRIQEELITKENFVADLKKWFAYSTRLAIVGEIAKGLTHEINNPLQIILGKIQMADMGIGSEEVLKHVESQSLHIASLLRSLSDISKDRKRDCSDAIELNSFIRNTVDVIKKQVEKKGIKIHYCFQNENNIIHADSGYLRPLILNSVLEAKKRMPSGGELSIHTSIQDNEVVQIEFQHTAQRTEGVLNPNSKSADMETTNYEEIVTELLADEIGAIIEYKDGGGNSGNRIVFNMPLNM